jgi:mannitol-specific phosphotransferase system IIBC component
MAGFVFDECLEKDVRCGCRSFKVQGVVMSLHILFICDGNMHRSALGAYWMTQLLQCKGITDIDVDSRGVRGLAHHETKEMGVRSPRDHEVKWKVSSPLFSSIRQ